MVCVLVLVRTEAQGIRVAIGASVEGVIVSWWTLFLRVSFLARVLGVYVSEMQCVLQEVRVA